MSGLFVPRTPETERQAQQVAAINAFTQQMWAYLTSWNYAMRPVAFSRENTDWRGRLRRSKPCPCKTLAGIEPKHEA